MEKVEAEELEWGRYDERDVEFRRKRLSENSDSRDLGCSLYELESGGRSWPYHYHTGNEEALYVLEGTGTLLCEGGELGISSGTYVSLPADQSGGGHRVVKREEGVLRYLMFSTMNDPDVTVYPEMEKIGVVRRFSSRK